MSRTAHTDATGIGWVYQYALDGPGAAFGLHLGRHSRWIFLALTAAALWTLGELYRATRDDDGLRAVAIGLVCGGAVGNVINRLWSASGVVDFIDVGISLARWPTFNVADIGLTVGGVLLAWARWGEERGGGRPGGVRGHRSGWSAPGPEGFGAARDRG